MEKGIKIGEERGLKKGEKNKAIEMAQKMKKAGEPPDKISNYTGLPKEEIQKL